MRRDCRSRVVRRVVVVRDRGAMRSVPFADLLRRLGAELLAALVPPACAACRAPLRDAGAVLCVACRRALPWLAQERCPRCGLPSPCAPGGAACPARRP